MKFRDENGRWESIRRHSVKGSEDGTNLVRYVVLERPPLLAAEPPGALFQDPPFNIRRPGAYAENGNIHFVVHAPTAARLRVIGSWTNWEQKALEMRSTSDGAYWWARVPIQDLQASLGRNDYHGVEYQFLLNDSEKLQDPAAGWMKSSWNQDVSKLVQSDKFAWGDAAWHRPGWDYLNVYQLHVSRFSNRFPDEAPLRRVAREIDTPGRLPPGARRDGDPRHAGQRSRAARTRGAMIPLSFTRSRTTMAARTHSKNSSILAIGMAWRS